MLEPQQEFQIGQLAQAAQVCGLSKRGTIPPEVKAIVGNADADKRHLNMDELSIVCKLCATSEHAIRALIDDASNLVDGARRRLLNEQGNLVLPGGKLYPDYRAEACWRDCHQFHRVITYGVACNCSKITDSDGMESLRMLYKLVDVPVPALLFALKQLRSLSAIVLEKGGFANEIRCLNMANDDLMQALLPLET